MSVDVSFRIKGTQDAEKVLEKIQRGVLDVAELRMFVGSPDPRARWFERGFRPRGGPTLVPGRHMLERAAQRHLPGLGEQIAAALDKGEPVYRAALERGKQIAAAAAAAAPQGTRRTTLKGRGRLRDANVVRTGRRR